MIKSMTGYGGGRSSSAEHEFTVEIKSVNNRFLEVTARLPRGFLFAEEAVKAAVQSRVTRGKVDVFLSLASLGQSDITVTVNEALAAEYKAAVDKLAGDLGISGDISAYQISKYADVLTLDKKELDREKALKTLMLAVDEALSEHDAMRVREGGKLLEDIVSRLELIESYVLRVEERSPETVKEYREKLLARMKEVLEGAQIDESRILTEATVFADRVAVDEETVRLRSHMGQMREILKNGGSVGRKLDFLVQEMNREVNTIGSKCGDSEITRLVLEMKSEIEKIREQVQNLE